MVNIINVYLPQRLRGTSTNDFYVENFVQESLQIMEKFADTTSFGALIKSAIRPICSLKDAELIIVYCDDRSENLDNGCSFRDQLAQDEPFANM
jgi:hypothetical protein